MQGSRSQVWSMVRVADSEPRTGLARTLIGLGITEAFGQERQDAGMPLTVSPVTNAWQGLVCLVSVSRGGGGGQSPRLERGFARCVACIVILGGQRNAGMMLGRSQEARLYT